MYGTLCASIHRISGQYADLTSSHLFPEHCFTVKDSSSIRRGSDLLYHRISGLAENVSDYNGEADFVTAGNTFEVLARHQSSGADQLLDWLVRPIMPEPNLSLTNVRRKSFSRALSSVHWRDSNSASMQTGRTLHVYWSLTPFLFSIAKAAAFRIVNLQALRVQMAHPSRLKELDQGLESSSTNSTTITRYCRIFLVSISAINPHRDALTKCSRRAVSDVSPVLPTRPHSRSATTRLPSLL